MVNWVYKIKKVTRKNYQRQGNYVKNDKGVIRSGKKEDKLNGEP